MLRNNKNRNLWKFSKIATINERNNFQIYSTTKLSPLREAIPIRRPLYFTAEGKVLLKLDYIDTNLASSVWAFINCNFFSASFTSDLEPLKALTSPSRGLSCSK